MNLSSRSDLVREVCDFYAEELEFPSEAVGPETELEAELGVDSLHQITLLGQILKRYGAEEAVDDVADGLRANEYPTPSAVVDLLLELAAEAGGNPQAGNPQAV
ncbi:acyl carrier protein [Kitasatospora sp. NPDC059463]|uniref:acyl carrier protein n=1 Tax=unclassified Kitasatospora TaxID=2633591 RepID=UPI003679CB71